MSLDQDKIIRIEEEAKKIIASRPESFPDETTMIRNAPFHTEFLSCFKDRLKPLKLGIPQLVALASWLHGLNTSLGSGFENFAHILSGGYKRSFTGHFVLKVGQTQAARIEQIIRDLKSGNVSPDLKRENNALLSCIANNKEIDSLAFTVDNYLESKYEIDAIELKSVRPNSGEGRGEKQKILYGKAALMLLHRKKEIKFMIGFPFDPTSDSPTKYNKERFFNYLIEFKKFFDMNEILIGSELWDHLSGEENTMDKALEIIRKTVKKIQH